MYSFAIVAWEVLVGGVVVRPEPLPASTVPTHYVEPQPHVIHTCVRYTPDASSAKRERGI